MRPSQALQLNRIRAIAARHRVKSIRVFGSALRGDDAEGSDLNLLRHWERGDRTPHGTSLVLLNIIAKEP